MLYSDKSVLQMGHKLDLIISECSTNDLIAGNTHAADKE